MKTFDAILIATGNSQNLLQQMLQSVKPGHLQLYAVVVNQGPKHTFSGAENLHVETIQINKPMGLSAARNVALRFVADENLEAHHILFPDDDTTFPVDFFTIYQEKVKPESAVLSRVCNVDDGKNYKPFPPENLFKQTKTLLPFVASVGLIIPQKTTQQVGLFDERLGAGAEWASSEDVDYFLRCTAFTSFDFVKELFTFHPSRFGKYASMEASAIKKRFVDYTRGYMFVMVRHRADHNLWFLPWRAFGGAAASFLKGEWRLMPVYLWLAMYRFRLLRDFKKIKKTNPAFFYG